MRSKEESIEGAGDEAKRGCNECCLSPELDLSLVSDSACSLGTSTKIF